MDLTAETLPILQWASEFPEDAKELIADIQSLPKAPPFEPLVDPMAQIAHVVTGAVDRFPVSVLKAHATPADAIKHYSAKLDAHKLGDGTLLQGIIKNLPTIISILQLFGVKLPTLPTS